LKELKIEPQKDSSKGTSNEISSLSREGILQELLVKILADLPEELRRRVKSVESGEVGESGEVTIFFSKTSEETEARKKPVIPRKSAGPEVIAEVYGTSPGTLANWRMEGIGPKFYRVGRKILYRFDDCDRFFFSNPVMTKDAHWGN
jgi:hypothetical protein